jgi:hypothetical protein
MTATRKSLADEVQEVKALADSIRARRGGTDGAALTKNTPTPLSVFGPETAGQAPHARNGEDPLSSRGYSFIRLIKALTGQGSSLKSPWEQAKSSTIWR